MRTGDCDAGGTGGDGEGAVERAMMQSQAAYFFFELGCRTSKRAKQTRNDEKDDHIVHSHSNTYEFVPSEGIRVETLTQTSYGLKYGA